MPQDLVGRLRGAQGQSCQVLVVFLDVRGFSSFAGVAESTDTALYLRAMYTSVIEKYFPDADFAKPTGDGLMLIQKLRPDADELANAVKKVVQASIRLVDDFANIADGDLMINFNVPRHLGIGIARGSATELVDGNGSTIDFSGRCLNLAARLMDLARPEGVVIHDRHCSSLLGELIGDMHASDVYIRGIAEVDPIQIFFPKGQIALRKSATSPPFRVKEFDKPTVLSVGAIRDRQYTYLIPLDREPVDTLDIELVVEVPTYDAAGATTGEVDSYRHDGRVIQEPDGWYVEIALAPVKRNLTTSRVPNREVEVKFTPFH